MDSYQTYIDHDCQLDRQGYPIYPNGRTTFVKLPEMEATNFGSVGFTKRMGIETPKDPGWKIKSIYCLGVMLCNQQGCQWAGSPPTGTNGIANFLESNPKCRGMARKCPGKVYHQPCHGTMTQFDTNTSTGWALMHHKGVHEHPWPKAKKPDPLSKEAFEKQVKNNPKAGAFKLKVGHPSALAKRGYAPEKQGSGAGENLLAKMFAWNEQGLLIISSSFAREKEHFTCQTSWMAKQLTARLQNNQVYQGGLLSDLTYKFFENGYLLTTSMFSQKNGYVPAYMEVFQEGDREAVLKNLKGCHEHFRAQITRIKQNRTIIQAKDKAKFAEIFTSLLKREKPEGPTHKDKLDSLRCRFPKAKRWIDWWSMSEIQSILFPSCRPKSHFTSEGNDGLPDTTNAQESMVELFSFAKSLEENFHAVMRGISIKYGSQVKGQVKVAQSMGWAKPRKRLRHKDVNDGRAPDTTKALTQDEPVLKRKKLGRPPGARNVNRNPFSTYPSYSASNDPLRCNWCWMAAALESLYALYNPLWL
ncbi:hypothetical protein PCASD_08466 [Puccinia coronata f. sp. avenae]|uniref:GCM domain-containing protein n=1 Tax=Puccinia coronata f. sp. avenae TaxID=200324 RepID=A0A2N5UMN8_9BASI|nr:hypothetical protein PCASD_08466 [Puccinia coronata f. sp. avenae]